MKNKWKHAVVACFIGASATIGCAEPIEGFKKRVIPREIPNSSVNYEIMQRLKSARKFVFFRNFDPMKLWGSGFRQSPTEQVFDQIARKGLKMAFLLDGRENLSHFVNWAQRYPNVVIRWNVSKRNHGFIDGPAKYVIFDNDVLDLYGQATYLSIDEWKDYLDDFTNSWSISDPKRRKHY
jgi:hypothetical protein